jgi:hypothetical protein
MTVSVYLDGETSRYICAFGIAAIVLETERILGSTNRDGVRTSEPVQNPTEVIIADDLARANQPRPLLNLVQWHRHRHHHHHHRGFFSGFDGRTASLRQGILIAGAKRGLMRSPSRAFASTARLNLQRCKLLSFGRGSCGLRWFNAPGRGDRP